MPKVSCLRHGYNYALLLTCLLFTGCSEKPFDPEVLSYSKNKSLFSIRKDTDSTIYISDNIIIADKGPRRDSLFNYHVFESFLENLVKSGRFLFVPMNKLSSATSSDKVIISLRHDIDYDIPSSMRFARIEYELGIRSTFYILHTADYYCEPLDTLNMNLTAQPEALSIHTKPSDNFPVRQPNLIYYLKKLQDTYHHEIGWHNDLGTLDVVYNINPGEYLKSELEWLHTNNIFVDGTSFHGSAYCYKYRYLNAFFWKEHHPSNYFYNYENVIKGNQTIKIDKYNLSDFNFKYEAGLIPGALFYADVYRYNQKRWHMNMINWNSFKPGTKIIIVFHPALWDSF